MNTEIQLQSVEDKALIPELEAAILSALEGVVICGQRIKLVGCSSIKRHMLFEQHMIPSLVWANQIFWRFLEVARALNGSGNELLIWGRWPAALDKYHIILQPFYSTLPVQLSR